MRRVFIFALLFLLLPACRQTDLPPSTGFLQGNLAFLPYQDEVHILDISNEAQPQLLHTLTLPAYVVKVLANGRFLYVLQNTSATSWDGNAGPPDAGLQIVDISNPEQPQMRGFFRTPDLPTDMVQNQELLYVADWSHITVVDVRNPDAPKERHTIDQGAGGLAFDGTQLQLVSSWGGCSFRSGYCQGGLHLFDLTDPAQPQLIGEMTAEAQPGEQLPGLDVALGHGYAFATGKGVWVVHLADGETMQIDGRFPLDNGWLYDAKIIVEGNIAYVTQHDGLQLLDISQPEAPQPLAHYPTSNQLVDLTWRDGRIYLAGWSGLEIVDVRDPNNPNLIGTYATDYPAQLFPQPTATPTN